MTSVAIIAVLFVASLVLPAAAPKARTRPKPKLKSPAPTLMVNPDALRPFLDGLAALEAAPGDRVVRVLHFGDSHTAADYWTGRIRQRLQGRFGDAGPGFVLPGKPWRGYPREGVRILSGRNWPAQSLRSGEGDGWVGLPGAAITGVEGEIFHLRAPFARFTIQVLAAPGFLLHGAVVAPAEETVLPSALPTPLPAFSDLAKHSEEVLSNRALQVFGPSQGEANKTPTALVQDLMFSLPDGVTLLGVDLRSGRPGVLYDELGLNGASLLDLEKWNPELRRALLARAKPDIVVLAYGTNDEGLGSEAVLDYQARMRTLLRQLKEEAQAPILVIGPLDRFGNRRRARPVLKAGAARVIADMKQACFAEGCVFWDAREAMGGYGSICQWRRAGMAQRDLVHLTGRGYERLGDLFCDQLLERYERRDQPPASLAPPKGRKKGK